MALAGLGRAGKIDSKVERVQHAATFNSPRLAPGVWSYPAWELWFGVPARSIDVIRRADQRLLTLLAHARSATRLYGELYRDLPPTSQLRLTDLPVLTKSMLMADIAASCSDPDITGTALDSFLSDSKPGELFRNRYALWTTSGTTGTPGIFLHDRAALAVYDVLELIRFRGEGNAAGLAANLFKNDRYAMVAATGGHFAGVSTIERLRASYPWLANRLRCISLLQPLSRLVAQLNDAQPTVLATYPTAASMLADEQRAGRLHLKLNELWTGGECLDDAARERLAREFGCRIRNGYGASEFLSIAAECRCGRLHVNTDWVLLEGVDKSYRPVAPGEASHTVLLTNLANRAQPLIRYDLGDSITMLTDPCACGSVLPAVRVEGRNDDVLSLAAESQTEIKLLPLVISTVLEEGAHVHDFQLAQTDRARLELRLAPAERSRAPAAAAALRHHLDEHGLREVVIEVARGEPRRSGHSGKVRRVQNETRCLPVAAARQRQRRGKRHHAESAA